MVYGVGCTPGFQPTLPRGERLGFLALGSSDSDFNPRSHEGSDMAQHKLVSSFFYFNPRSHEGSDARD